MPEGNAKQVTSFLQGLLRTFEATLGTPRTQAPSSKADERGALPNQGLLQRQTLWATLPSPSNILGKVKPWKCSFHLSGADLGSQPFWPRNKRMIQNMEEEGRTELAIFKEPD